MPEVYESEVLARCAHEWAVMCESGLPDDESPVPYNSAEFSAWLNAGE